MQCHVLRVVIVAFAVVVVVDTMYCLHSAIQSKQQPLLYFVPASLSPSDSLSLSLCVALPVVVLNSQYNLYILS